MCSGKIYYDLESAGAERKFQDVALVRIEQLYPLPDEIVVQSLKAYSSETPVTWVQEEPENMGPWPYMRVRFGERLLGRFPFSVCARPPSASPATGSSGSHKLEQQALIAKAFQT